MRHRRVSRAAYPAAPVVVLSVAGARYVKLNEEYQSRVKFLPADEQRAWHEANK
jgi:hypothetical protein